MNRYLYILLSITTSITVCSSNQHNKKLPIRTRSFSTGDYIDHCKIIEQARKQNAILTMPAVQPAPKK